jgi:hypothetical protein
MTLSIDKPITKIAGLTIAKWAGLEMAIGGGDSILDECSQGVGALTETPPVWEHSSIPFMQFAHIDILIKDGSAYRLCSRASDGTSFYGFYIREITNSKINDEFGKYSIYRLRELDKLPTGVAQVQVLRQDGKNAITEVELSIDATKVRLLAGEVYEREDGFQIVESDESILMQVNGQRPNWSFG